MAGARPTACGLVLMLLLANMVNGAESEPGAGRLNSTFEGIECEYSPGGEELARLLAHRFALHNAEAAAPQGPEKTETLPTGPLSPAEMRTHRDAYLGGIAAQLGLAQPTSLQEECYDAFLDNYELTMSWNGHLRAAIATLQVIRRVTIWPRDELIRRLGAGETIVGFAYDPATRSGTASFGFTLNSVDERLKDFAARREQLRLAYRMSVNQRDGKAVYRGSVGPKEPAPTVTSDPPPVETNNQSELFPVIVPSELASLSAAELAQALWNDTGERSVMRALEDLRDWRNSLALTDPHLGFIVLHETTELGILNQYFRGPDRRWFCDGVANYVPWRVVRDLHGRETADSIYNLPVELARYAGLREQADLRKWAAAENQSDAEQETELNSARYAFAANAVFLMNERAGENVLPRLFAEIRKTRPDKVSIVTMEKAWKKVTRTKLEDILSAAVQPSALRDEHAGAN